MLRVFAFTDNTFDGYKNPYRRRSIKKLSFFCTFLTYSEPVRGYNKINGKMTFRLSDGRSV